MIKSAAVELQNAESGGICLLDFLEKREHRRLLHYLR